MEIQNNLKNADSVSVIIPLFNEEKSIEILYKEIVSVFSYLPNKYEIIFINDGSQDHSQVILERVIANNTENNARIVQFKRNIGKATALNVGFSLAKGDIVITMDADLQDDPKEIPRFIEKINKNYDVVSGWKKDRKDSFIKNNTSKIYNFFTSLFSGVWLHDHNCGFKAYKGEAVKNLELYGQLHRYIPVLISANGYNKVTEIKVNHRKRVFGNTKYGSKRFFHGFLDLLTVFYITKYKNSPLHFFGLIGALFFSSGFIIGLYLVFLKIIFSEEIGERPLLFLSILLIIIGIQITATGLIGEQITHSSKIKKDFIIKKII